MQAQLERDDARLATIEVKLDEAIARIDALARKVDTVSQWTAAQTEKDKLRDAGGQGSGSGAGDTTVADESDLSAASRAIEGAVEAIRCEEVGTDQISCTIDKAFVESLAADPARLAMQARIVPAMEGGSVRGFKVYGIRRDSLPTLLLLKNGDVIKAVNTIPIASADDVLTMFTKLRSAKHFEIEIERRGAPLGLVVDITG